MKTINDKVDMDKVIELGLINGEDYYSIEPKERGYYGNIYLASELTLQDKKDLVSMVDFEIVEDSGQYKLVDMQGANLADIESERFDSIDDIIDRLDVYFYDYLIAILTKDDFEKIKLK